MIARRLAILLLLTPLAAAPGIAADSSPEEALHRAERLEKDGSYRKALAIYTDFLATHPDHIQAMTAQFRIAICLDNLAEPEKAIESYSKLIEQSADKPFKHRAEAFMKLAKLQASLGRHEKGVATLVELLNGGAGLYEDEAHNLAGGYYAILGKYNEAAVMFDVLKSKRNSPLAKEAAYKLAIVWMQGDDAELARHAIEEFAEQYPTHPRTVELYVRLAKHYYGAQKYKSAVAVCEQIKAQYGARPEAMEAAFIVALCYREAENYPRAVETLEALATATRGRQNDGVAVEALFEIAEIYRTRLNQLEPALDFYRRAADRVRGRSYGRLKKIREHSLFHIAEHHYRKSEWSAALDVYLQLRDLGTEMNVLGRILHCRSKMNNDGDAVLSGATEDEQRFVKQRIAKNPGTLIALQGEVFLLDRKLAGPQGRPAAWPTMKPVVDAYAALLTNYPPNILQMQDMKSYIRMRIGQVCTAADPSTAGADAEAFWRRGLGELEQALAENTNSLFRVEILESVATLSQTLGDTQKAFDAYGKLFALTGADATRIRRENETRGRDNQLTDPAEYVRGLASLADTTAMVDEAIATIEGIIARAPAGSGERREAQFYLAELYYMKKRYSDAAREYKKFLKEFGAPQDRNGDVISAWREPATIDDAIDQNYEAALRLAHCWYTQGHTANMVEAYQWIIRNQYHRNPRMAEAEYMVATHPPKGTSKRDAKRREAEDLWKKVINPSMDFGSKQFKKEFHHWIREPDAVPYVKAAFLRSGEGFSELGRHDVAAEIFKQYLVVFDPTIRIGGNSPAVAFPRDEMYDIASYSVGREYIQAGDAESMATFYRPYIDEHREVVYRPSILMLLGHYGTEAELYHDAREAYAALLDEYGPANELDEEEKPIPIPKESWLREKSTWNGIRMAPPEDWDVGKIRYSLGFLYWKKEDWRNVVRTLTPFVGEAELRANPVRPKALFMLGRSHFKLDDDRAGADVLQTLLADHAGFSGAEEAYVDLVAGGFRLRDWATVDRQYQAFVAKHPVSERRAYMDLYSALSSLGQGQTAVALTRLGDLAKADTYQDVKADANYHIARHLLVGAAPDRKEAFKRLEKSVRVYPRAESLLAAGRCAVELEKWDDARTYLDRCIREFPRTDKKNIEDARLLLAKVAEADARAKQ